MLRRMLSVLLVLAFLCAAPVLTGCNDDQDEIKVQRTVTVEDLPVGEPQPKVE